MSFFTPPPKDPVGEFTELLESFGGIKSIMDALRKFGPKAPDAPYSAATHTRPLKLPDGSVDPHRFESVMTVLRGAERHADVVAEQVLTPDMAQAYLAAITDAMTSATYEAAFIKNSLEKLKVPVLSLMGQLDRFRKAAWARENKDLILRYRPAASIDGVPTVQVFYAPADGGDEVPMGFWTLQGVIAHMSQLQISVGLVSKNEEFSRALEEELEIADVDDRHHYLQSIQSTLMELVSEHTGDLFDIHEADSKDG